MEEMQHTLRSGLSSFSSLARSHDDLPAFNAAYWVLTFMAAMLFNIGAFVLLIAGHVILDVYKYRTVHGKKWHKVAEGVVRENLLDVSLLSLGVAFSVYLHASLPIIAGLRGILRTEITLLNAIVQLTVKVHILHNVLMLLSHFSAYLEHVHPRMGKSGSIIESVSAVALAASLSLTLLSPWILGLDATHLANLAQDIFIPWRI